MSELKYAAPRVGELRVIEDRWLWVHTRNPFVNSRLGFGDVLIVLDEPFESFDIVGGPFIKMLSRFGVCYASHAVMRVHTELL